MKSIETIVRYHVSKNKKSDTRSLDEHAENQELPRQAVPSPGRAAWQSPVRFVEGAQTPST